MKKTVAIGLFLSLLLFSLSIISMDLFSDKYKRITFIADDGIVEVEKQNVALIGALCERYDLYLKSSWKNKNIPIPLLPDTAKKEAIILVNEALNARPDTFKDYLEALSNDKRDILLKASLLLKQDGKIVGLHVPEIAKRLLKIDFPKDIIDKISLLIGAEKEKETIVNFCLGQCIKKQGFLNLGMQESFSRRQLDATLSWDSSFFPGSFSHNRSLKAKPLPIGRSLYKTYGSVFFSDRYEIRIIDGVQLQSREFTQQPLGNACSLYVIDHKTGQSVANQDIVHANNIKGYCSTKVDNDTHYFVTYSDKDIIFSTVTKNGIDEFIIDHGQAKTPAEIVTACFRKSTLHVVTYEDYRSVLYRLDSNNHWQTVTSFHFKEWGMMDQMFAIDCGFVMLFSVGSKPKAYLLYKNLDMRRLGLASSNLVTDSDCMFFLQRGKSHPNRRLLAWLATDTVFKALQSYRKNQEEANGLLQRFKNRFSFFEPDNECHKVYSPDGRFMMTNKLIKKMGKLYIKTSIEDVMSQQEIISYDTAHDDWGIGIGFSNDSRSLLFFDPCKNSSIMPLITDEFEKCINQFEKFAFQDLGTMALISRLIREILKKHTTELRESDPTRAMLSAWANNKEGVELKDFMRKCFPFGIAS